MNPIPVLLVTYNRLEYTKQAVASICANPGLPIRLLIWDNCSEDLTPFWLNSLAGRQLPNTVDVETYLSAKNVGLAPAMNYFFRKYADVPYVAKVDNDTVLPDNWLADLMDVMRARGANPKIQGQLGAVSGVGWRPYGMTSEEWFATMPNVPLRNGHKLHFHTYTFGTGVLINMDLIRERGLLFERFPRAPEAGPDDPCLISGWTAYIREAAEYEGWKFAMYSKVWMRLLNLSAELTPSGDYPAYDAEIQRVRDEGNEWWTSVGGMDGVRKYVQEHGGLEPLSGYKNLRDPIGYARQESQCDHQWHRRRDGRWCTACGCIEFGVSGPSPSLPPSVWSDSDHLKESSTFEYWSARVKANGTTASTFLSTPQARINEFTAQHMQILQRYCPGKDVLEAGVGWGRTAGPIAQMAKSYIGVDFVPELIAKARESLPALDFRVASATELPFEYPQFDVVVAIACLSSFASHLDDVLKELRRVLRPDGYILFLEENFARIDWKLGTK